MERDPDDLLVPPVPGTFGLEGKPPLRVHAVERELHAVAGATLRAAVALERNTAGLEALARVAPSIEAMSRDIAALRKLVERNSR